MSLPIPDKIEEITADWLSQVLRSRNMIDTEEVVVYDWQLATRAMGALG